MKSHRSYAAVMAVALAVSTEDRLAGNVAATESRVPVCMEKGGHEPTAVKQAQTMAAGLFASIGIAIEWRDLYRRCEAGQDQPILVQLSMHTDYREFPGALAYALPFEGRHIRVFYDRVLEADRGRVSYVLAYTLVHEITHVLQGSNCHSDSGIMKRRWNAKDYAAMERRTLLFEERDVRLIQLGLQARAQQRASGKLGGEPASRKVPVPLQSGDRNVERLRSLGLGQAAKEAQLDDFGGARIEGLQPR